MSLDPDQELTDGQAAPKPVNIETYGEEIREYFLNRSDQMHFQIRSPLSCQKFFSGRSDGIREITETQNQLVVTFSERQDKLLEFKRFAVGSAYCFQANYETRTDGVKSFHLALSSDISVGADTAAQLYREKVQHVAVKFDRARSKFNLEEVYQDIASSTLRFIVQELDDGLHKANVYFNAEPTKDPRYEDAKIYVMESIQTILSIVRELHLSFSSNGKLSQPLKSLALSLFQSLDNSR